ncbi:tetratricopeptide repeat protein [Massilia sp. TS11]|uniref:tetratricopeptide repeat protein n=1 Tax=Massilia sp. TS11 TaxID=2908003 RepID=UPI001EDC84FE|nr:tetratricopeptide repeat protein [Massilia sp. TS11]MCG2585664.1 hypothetical protein [Massilia sp. TS11]
MSHTRFARISVLLAALLGAAAFTAPAYAAEEKKEAAPAANTVRPEVFKLIDAAVFKDLMAQKKYDDVKARLAQAMAIPNLTPFEEYAINNQRMVLASTTGDNKTTLEILEKVVHSPFLPKTEVPRLLEVMVSLYFNEKNYPKTIAAAKEFQTVSDSPNKVNPTLYRAYAYSNDYVNAKATLDLLMAESAKGGKPASKEDLNNLAFLANKMKDDALYVKTLEQIVTLYPSEEYWLDLLNRVRRVPGYAQPLDLFVLRLQMLVTKQLPDEFYYTDLAELDMLEGFFTEAKQVVDAGYQANLLGTGNNAAKHKALRDKANKASADDIKNIAAGEASAAKAKDGIGLVKTGYAYVTMGQIDKGLGFMQQGIAKGVAKRPDDAKLLLGIAYYKAKKYDEAIKTFAEVKANDGSLEVARFWTIKVKQEQAGK